MKFRNNELFLYKERSFPLERDPRKNPLERAVYVWKFACTGNKIKRDSEIVLGRFIDKSKNRLIKYIVDFYNLNNKSKIILLSNKDYHGNFITDGSHGHDWLHQEKGIDNSVLRLFADSLRYKGIKVLEKEVSISARYFFG